MLYRRLFPLHQILKLMNRSFIHFNLDCKIFNDDLELYRFRNTEHWYRKHAREALASSRSRYLLFWLVVFFVFVLIFILFTWCIDSYWCMTKLLERIQENYVFSQPGIQKKIQSLEDLIKRIDSKLELIKSNFSIKHCRIIISSFVCFFFPKRQSLSAFKKEQHRIHTIRI